MKVLNRKQYFARILWMRGVRAATPCQLAALALPGCMHTPAPVAVQPPLGPGGIVLVGERWF
jgi:hypothetical protein